MIYHNETGINPSIKYGEIKTTPELESKQKMLKEILEEYINENRNGIFIVDKGICEINDYKIKTLYLDSYKYLIKKENMKEEIELLNSFINSLNYIEKTFGPEILLLQVEVV